MNTTETPRCEAERFTAVQGPVAHSPDLHCVSLAFARQLERELAAATRPVGDELQGTLASLRDLVAHGGNMDHSDRKKLINHTVDLLSRLWRELQAAKDSMKQPCKVYGCQQSELAGVLATQQNRAEAAERALAERNEDSARLDWLFAHDTVRVLGSAEKGYRAFDIADGLTIAGAGATPRAAIDAAKSGTP